MIPIQLDKEEIVNKNILQKRILDLCKKSHMNDRARVFSILLYNDSNVFVYKMLKDDDFFNSLDHLSGNILSIIFLSTFHGNFSYDLNEKFNNSIEEVFNIENKSKKALLILFQVNKENKILDYYIYKFNDINTDYVYNLLREICLEINKSLSNITNENKDNYQQIINLSIESLKYYKKGKIIKILLDKTISILGIISSIKTFIPS